MISPNVKRDDKTQHQPNKKQGRHMQHMQSVGNDMLICQ